MNKPIYCHHLDYVCGLKYCLTNGYVKVEYRQSPDTFIVEELIDYGKLGYSRADGEYVLYRLVKKGVDTLYALRTIAKYYRIPYTNIGFLGLKDRDSLSVQYITIKKHLVREDYARHNELVFERDNIKLYFIGYIRGKLHRKALIGNRFSIRIGDPKYTDLVKDIIKKINKYGLPSYYGYQRFGTKRYNTHLIGKYIILGNIAYAVRELLYSLYPRETINSLIARSERKLNRIYRLYYEWRLSRILSKKRSLEAVIYGLKKNVLLLFIEAYQSYLFNEALNRYIKKYGWVREEEICVYGPGCRGNSDLYHDILCVEGLSADSLVNSLSSYGVSGWRRNIVLKLVDPEINILNGELWIKFTLGIGQYATIVLRELFKENLLI